MEKVPLEFSSCAGMLCWTVRRVARLERPSMPVCSLNLFCDGKKWFDFLLILWVSSEEWQDWVCDLIIWVSWPFVDDLQLRSSRPDDGSLQIEKLPARDIFLQNNRGREETFRTFWNKIVTRTVFFFLLASPSPPHHRLQIRMCVEEKGCVGTVQ
jgi:hypothetical protein